MLNRKQKAAHFLSLDLNHLVVGSCWILLEMILVEPFNCADWNSKAKWLTIELSEFFKKANNYGATTLNLLLKISIELRHG